MVIQHECQNPTTFSILEDHSALANTTDNQRPPFGRGKGAPSSGGGRRQPYKICTYCGHTGHTINVFYKKHGYPPGHPRYPSRPLYHSRDSASAAMNSSAVDTTLTVEDEELKEDTHGPGLRLTHGQYQSLMALVQCQPI